MEQTCEGCGSALVGTHWRWCSTKCKSKARRRADPKKARQQQREHMKRNRRVYRFAAKYGMTAAEARVLLASQPSECEVCKREGPVDYDHCHASGKHRGWLCRQCNVALGQAHDDPQVLRALANYLEVREYVVGMLHE